MGGVVLPASRVSLPIPRRQPGPVHLGLFGDLRAREALPGRGERARILTCGPRSPSFLAPRLAALPRLLGPLPGAGVRAVAPTARDRLRLRRAGGRGGDGGTFAAPSAPTDSRASRCSGDPRCDLRAGRARDLDEAGGAPRGLDAGAAVSTAGGAGAAVACGSCEGPCWPGRVFAP